jgi:hypothetical protein
MSRTSIAKLALLVALLAAEDAGAARRDKARTEVRLFKVEVSALTTHRQYWSGKLYPDAPTTGLDENKRIEWSATGRNLRVQATGRRGRWRRVSLLGGAKLTGEVKDYDYTRKSILLARLDVPNEAVPRWSTCNNTWTSSLNGPSEISGWLGGSLKPIRLDPRVSGTVRASWGNVTTDCLPTPGAYPGRDMEIGVASGEIDTLARAKRGCRRAGNFDNGWHQSCIATKRVVDKYGIVHTQTLDVEIVLTRRTSRR